MKKIDKRTAAILCRGCIHQKDLWPGCMTCFVQVRGEWRAMAREPGRAGVTRAIAAGGGPPPLTRSPLPREPGEGRDLRGDEALYESGGGHG